MTRAESVIDRLLIDAKQALDQMPLDEDAATLEALGCEFRRNPAGDSDLMSATVPI